MAAMKIKNLLLKIILSLLGLIILTIVGSLLYLRLSCKAIQIIKTHKGNTQYSIISQRGDSHEPASCSGFPVVVGME